MNTSNDKPSDAAKNNTVKIEVAKGERNEVLEKYSLSRRQEMRERPRSKFTPKITKQRALKAITVRSLSARIEELAKPNRRYVLITLREKASTLPPAFVDNLTRITETESCLTPEEATQILRRKQCKKKKTKVTRLPSREKRWMEEIKKLDTAHAVSMLDRDATMCQYVMAMRLVKNILEHQCKTQRKDYREITYVILRRLSFLNGYASVQDSQTTQQLHLLANVVADWISEILVEVAETYKETLEEYCRRRQMKMTEVDDDDETESEIEYWNWTEPKKLETEKSVKPEDEVKEWEEGDMRNDEILMDANGRTDEDVKEEKIEQQKDKEYVVQEEEEIEVREKTNEEETRNETKVKE